MNTLFARVLIFLVVPIVYAVAVFSASSVSDGKNDIEAVYLGSETRSVLVNTVTHITTKHTYFQFKTKTGTIRNFKFAPEDLIPGREYLIQEELCHAVSFGISLPSRVCKRNYILM